MALGCCRNCPRRVRDRGYDRLAVPGDPGLSPGRRNDPQLVRPANRGPGGTVGMQTVSVAPTTVEPNGMPERSNFSRLRSCMSTSITAADPLFVSGCATRTKLSATGPTVVGKDPLADIANTVSVRIRLRRVRDQRAIVRRRPARCHCRHPDRRHCRWPSPSVSCWVGFATNWQLSELSVQPSLSSSGSQGSPVPSASLSA